MKIISLNVNNFGGIKDKPHLKDYTVNNKIDWTGWNVAVDSWRELNKDIIEKNVSKIVCLIKDFDIVFLHEVDTNCSSWTQLHELMEEEYKWESANEVDKSVYKNGRKSISCVFIRKGIVYDYAEITNFSDKQRNIEIVVNGITVIGLHAPYDLKYWDSLIKRIKPKKNYIIIGDLNVFKLDTDRRLKFEELLNIGAKDLWLEQGENNNTPTANTNLRIDYALSSPTVFNKGIKAIILNSIRRTQNSDHAAVAVIY